MAYLIFNNTNSLVKIAANDSDRDSQNIVLSDHTVESISDSDFLKIRTGVATATYDGTSVTLTDNVIVSVSEIDFKKYLEQVIWVASNFLKENTSNSLYTSINQYKNYLENFDSSSLSFPYDKNIEQYCDENSIIFYHPLQIP
tara:strand:+ start:335 stop:763 length:429 start_codon:yes stop_codon:yes gene_type:complete